MSSLDDLLDSFAEEAARSLSRRPPRSGCGCAACSAGSAAGYDEAASRRPPRAARRQTSPRARGTQLPAWRGWSAPVSLRDINAARAAARNGQPVAPNLRPFLEPGPQVYRITRAGIDRDRPLTIGMTKSSNSIAVRVDQHHRLKKGDRQVHEALKNLQPGQILVQAARLDRADMHPRRARTYEGWLQDRERPLIYNRDSTTFDEAGLPR